MGPTLACTTSPRSRAYALLMLASVHTAEKEQVVSSRVCGIEGSLRRPMLRSGDKPVGSLPARDVLRTVGHMLSRIPTVARLPTRRIDTLAGDSACIRGVPSAGALLVLHHVHGALWYRPSRELSRGAQTSSASASCRSRRDEAPRCTATLRRANE
eukprot:gnl/Chilomastix_cuspidata/2481.p3 GENE.gnl/Chilomastix_cuspidata/2481~~gnl/Chilomastix_cuspidata/2481.p3  ORF type:complete len:156 (-),score=3.31 gnl/Chilomastix_cuspidata/2481:964-1431(-)